MKKILSIVLALTMVLALASCGGNTTTTSSVDTPVSSEEATSSVDTTAGGDEALAVLNNIYAQYPDDYKVFGGGSDMEVAFLDGPGEYSLSDVDAFTSVFSFPAESIAKVSGAAQLMHTMMINNFNIGAYKLVNPADKEALADELTTSIKNTQWICGFPENIIVASVGDVVISGYGLKELIDVFETALKTAYPDATIYTSEALEVR